MLEFLQASQSLQCPCNRAQNDPAAANCFLAPQPLHTRTELVSSTLPQAACVRASRIQRQNPTCVAIGEHKLHSKFRTGMHLDVLQIADPEALPEVVEDPGRAGQASEDGIFGNPESLRSGF